MTARVARGDLEVAAPDGRTLRFPAVWLRDNCPCEQCRDPRSGQKLLGIADLPDGIAVNEVAETAHAAHSTACTVTRRARRPGGRGTRRPLLRFPAGRTAFTGPASVCCRAATRTWTGWPVRWRYWRGWRRERRGHHR